MMLNQNPDMVQVMEDDLRQKVQVAIDCNPDLRMVVHGVFSVDDLEAKLESELGGCIGVGVQYVRAQKQTEAVTSNPSRGNSVRTLVFSFNVILGVPTTLDSDERTDATKLLSVLRLAILGKTVAEDRTQRTWDFVYEQPEPSASTATMLYYAQLWQVAMPVGSAT